MKIFFKNIIIVAILICVSLVSWKCNIINPAEPIPAYLTIDSATLRTNYSTQGTASQKITDAWVDVNGNLLGVYQIPKHFPVLNSGSTHLIIQPGILINGAAETRGIYPFYYPDTLTLNMQSKQNFNVNPVYHYRTTTQFLFMEDFEGQGFSFGEVPGLCDTNMVLTKDPSEVFEGKASGQIHLDATHTQYEGATDNAFILPTDGSPIYVELNYKCDMVFQVGVEYINSSTDETILEWTINPKDTWNKIYLNWTDVVQSLGAGDYKIIISANKSAAPGVGNVYLDNIKLLTI